MRKMTGLWLFIVLTILMTGCGSSATAGKTSMSTGSSAPAEPLPPEPVELVYYPTHGRKVDIGSDKIYYDIICKYDAWGNMISGITTREGIFEDHSTPVILDRDTHKYEYQYYFDGSIREVTEQHIEETDFDNPEGITATWEEDYFFCYDEMGPLTYMSYTNDTDGASAQMEVSTIFGLLPNGYHREFVYDENGRMMRFSEYNRDWEMVKKGEGEEYAGAVPANFQNSVLADDAMIFSIYDADGETPISRVLIYTVGKSELYWQEEHENENGNVRTFRISEYDEDGRKTHIRVSYENDYDYDCYDHYYLYDKMGRLESEGLYFESGNGYEIRYDEWVSNYELYGIEEPGMADSKTKERPAEQEETASRIDIPFGTDFYSDSPLGWGNMSFRIEEDKMCVTKKTFTGSFDELGVEEVVYTKITPYAYTYQKFN